MSWCIQTKGTGLAVAAYVAKITQYPQGGDQTHIETAKKLILSEIAAIYSKDVLSIISVEAAGHADAHGNRQMSVKVEKLNLLAPIPPNEYADVQRLLLEARQDADAPKDRDPLRVASAVGVAPV